MMTKNIQLHTDLCLDLICDQNDVNMRYNMQFFIQNLKLDMELIDYKDRREAQIIDLRRAFINVEESQNNKKIFGKLAIDNKEQIDGTGCKQLNWKYKITARMGDRRQNTLKVSTMCGP